MTAEAEMLASAGGYGLATKGPMHKKKGYLGTPYKYITNPPRKCMPSILPYH